ncbi:MAG TPA: cupin domain-containing protein [Dyella sp.]|uniref:cupin domain-containing protein n=1 Tax=Dyella sp. TaxID=1869338 RepID=UPI002D77C577|nr:cupin domain-containing protein [Dyella sp.]HET6552632.1 cupin domain-containing protein [Dyella sp.]
MAKFVRVGCSYAVMVAAFALAGGALAQDMAKVAPKNTKVLIDNDQVRVMEVWLKPGESLPMHSHPANVVVFVTGGKVKSTTSEGKVTEAEVKAGEARWSDAVTHSNENVGTASTKAVVVELKK